MKTLRQTMIAIAIVGGLSLENMAHSQEAAIIQEEVIVLHKVRIKAWCLNASGSPTGNFFYQNGCSDVSEQLAIDQAVSLAQETLKCEFPPPAFEIRSRAANLFCPEPPGGPGGPEEPIGRNEGAGAENCWKVVLKCYVCCGEPFLVSGYGRTPAEACCLAKNEMYAVAKDEGFKLRCFCCLDRVNLCCHPTR